MRSRLFVAAMLLASGCSAESGPLPLLWLGQSGTQTPASTGAAVFWVRADVSGMPGPDVLLDTGAPLSIINPSAFGGGVPSGAGEVAALTLGSVTLWRVPVVGISETLRLAPSGRLDGGIVGFTAYGQFATSFDYRDRTVVFGRGARPDGLLASTTVPFHLDGGGRALLTDGSIVDFPPSRVLVSAVVEGRTLTMLIDTGASWVALRSSVFSDIVAEDGRVTLMDQARLATGKIQTNVTRLRNVTIDALDVAGPPAASGAGIDELLDSLKTETGRTVDGAMGAPFLREFFVTLDYPAARLELSRYATRDHVHDEYRRVGFDLSASIDPSGGFRYRVAQVYPGTDAARLMIAAGDRVLAVDGQDLGPLAPGAADEVLLGQVGGTKTVAFSDRTIDVRVDELLPLP
jgi:hypothetical protein